MPDIYRYDSFMIKVWRPPHVAFAANLLVKKLIALGEDAKIVSAINPSDTCLYIIYNAASAKHLPVNYIVYQTEVAGSKWFSKKYAATLQRALAVWEYDPDNVKAYQHLNANVSIVTPGYELQVSNNIKTIPVLFYGYLKKSQIRSDMLASLQKQTDIKIVDNELTTGMWETLSQSAIVLNIHYYKNAPLETFRINEALSFGCKVISQASPTIPDKYRDVVRFADTAEDILNVLNEPEPAIVAMPVYDQLRNDHEIEQAMAKPLDFKKPKMNLLKQLFSGKLSRVNA